ncbi:MAG TPA: GntR family transcriptional regulator [Bacteroidales bacterium]|nr:GntR family transcriptional regulator [Bacteroidales bacterium]
MEFGNKKSIFLQIADNISERIMEGKYPLFEKIPSVRDLAIELGVNPNTIMRTYSKLQSDGILETRRGMGFYVAGDAKNIIIAQNKKLFFETDLPRIARQAEMLSITFEEIKPFFERKNYSDYNEDK